MIIRRKEVGILFFLLVLFLFFFTIYSGLFDDLEYHLLFFAFVFFLFLLITVMVLLIFVDEVAKQFGWGTAGVLGVGLLAFYMAIIIRVGGEGTKARVQKQNEKIEGLKVFIQPHLNELYTNYLSCIVSIGYGQFELSTSRWIKKVELFYERIIPPLISSKLPFTECYGIITNAVVDYGETLKAMGGNETDPNEMSGVEYEEFIANKVRDLGFQVTQTKGSGDHGVDLIAIKNDVRIAIQCKRYQSKVGNKAIQEVFSGSQYYSCTHSAVVTNNDFTPQAKVIAKTHNIILLNHNELHNLSSIA